MLQVKLRTVVWWIAKREMGCVLQPEEHCTKIGERMIEVLSTKHPEARPPTASSLDSYPGQPPDLSPVNVTEDMVMKITGHIY